MFVWDCIVQCVSNDKVVLNLACNNNNLDCPEVSLQTCTSTQVYVPQTQTSVLSTTQTVTARSTLTMNATQTQTSTLTTCTTAAPVPRSCSGCDSLAGNNMCDETTTCDGQKQCACRRGFKYENVAGSQNQWRLAIGGVVYVRAGLKCDLREFQ